MNTMYLLYALLILQVLDAATTIMILQDSGVELNPITSWLYKKLGPVPGLVVVKGVPISVFIYFGDVFPAPLIVALISLYGWVCWHNITQVRKK